MSTLLSLMGACSFPPDASLGFLCACTLLLSWRSAKGSTSRDYFSVSFLPISSLDVAAEVVDAVIEPFGIEHHSRL